MVERKGDVPNLSFVDLTTGSPFTMTRDQLARHVYIHAHDADGADDAWRAAGAEEWDTGQVEAKDVHDAYAEADRVIEKGAF